MMRERDVVARVRRVTRRRLRTWIEWGWIRPTVGDEGYLFSEADVARATLICDLSERMGLDEEAVPVVLHLIDQIHGLRYELKSVLEAIESLPKPVRAEIRARLERHLAPVDEG